MYFLMDLEYLEIHQNTVCFMIFGGTISLIVIFDWLKLKIEQENFLEITLLSKSFRQWPISILKIRK